MIGRFSLFHVCFVCCQCLPFESKEKRKRKKEHQKRKIIQNRHLIGWAQSSWVWTDGDTREPRSVNVWGDWHHVNHVRRQSILSQCMDFPLTLASLSEIDIVHPLSLSFVLLSFSFDPSFLFILPGPCLYLYECEEEERENQSSSWFIVHREKEKMSANKGHL